MNSTHKTCTGAHGCGKSKLRSHFTNDKSKKDGKRNRCKECQREFNKANPSNRKEADERYRKKPENRYKKYKASAESRGYQWNLTRDEFMTLWRQPCVHCNSPIETIGLDRIDSSLPYNITNVESCCSICNRLKSDMTTKEWYEHMANIVLHTNLEDTTNKHEITQEELKSHCSYDPITGIFTHNKTNKPLGSDHGGYLRFQVNGKRYLAHVLVWVYMYGRLPTLQIDHKDRDRSNNKLSNLREVSNKVNSLNKGMLKSNTSGVKGVSYVPRLDKWKAYIHVNGEQKYLGIFSNIKEATTAREQAETEQLQENM